MQLTYTHLQMQEKPTNTHTNFHVHMLNESALTLKKNAYCVFISRPIACLKWNKLENPNLHLLGPPGFPSLFLFLARPGYEGNSGIFLWRRLKVNMCILVSRRHTFPNSHFVKQGADRTVTQVSLFRVWISSGTPVLHAIDLIHTHLRLLFGVCVSEFFAVSSAMFFLSDIGWHCWCLAVIGHSLIFDSDKQAQAADKANIGFWRTHLHHSVSINQWPRAYTL